MPDVVSVGDVGVANPLACGLEEARPARSDAAQYTTKWKEGSRLAVFQDYTGKEGLIRPPTPQYPKLAKIFEKAASDISNGADVQTTLDGAVDEIDADIAANNGYGFK